MIGEGFHLHGLYYFTPDSRISKGFQAISAPINEHLLWHRCFTHPSVSVLNKATLVLS